MSVKNRTLECLSDRKSKDLFNVLASFPTAERVVAESIIADMIDDGTIKLSNALGRTLIRLSKEIKYDKITEEIKPDYEIVATLPEAMGRIKGQDIDSTRNAFLNIIEHAEGRLLVSQPFIDNAFVEIYLDQLRCAARRGVKLILLTRKVGLDVSSFKALMRIFEIFSMNSPEKDTLEVYEHWIPLKTNGANSRQFVGLHAKLMINQKEGYLGSANWTEFSLGNNVEFGLLIHDGALLRRLKDLLELTITQAQRIDMEKIHAKATTKVGSHLYAANPSENRF